MQDPLQRPFLLFQKVVFQAPLFTLEAKRLDQGLDEQIVKATATYYPLYRRLKHGLVLGQVSKGIPPGYLGPPIEFIYKTLANKVCFLCLKAGGFSNAELTALENTYDL